MMKWQILTHTVNQQNKKHKANYKISAFIWICCVFLLPLHAISQGSPERILGSFIFKNDVYNYKFIKENVDSYSFQISKSDTDDNQVRSFIFSDFTQDIFIDGFKIEMKKYFLNDTTTNNDSLEKKGIELFFKIQARLNFLDDEPITAYFILKKNNIRSFFLANTSDYYNGILSDLYLNHDIGWILIEIEDGAIKNIKVQLLMDKNTAIEFNQPLSDDTSSSGNQRSYLEFKNQYPVSISGKFDPEKFADFYLYCLDCNGVKGLSRYISLADLMTMDIVFESDKEDYSPANGVMSLSPNNPSVELKKEKRSKILEISAFTDFVGLDQEQPNGLIQIEAKRKININTNHYLLFPRETQKIASILGYGDPNDIQLEKIKTERNKKDEIKYVVKRNINDIDINKRYIKGTYDESKIVSDTITVREKKFRPVSYNIFGSIEPKLLFSKLEENTRYLHVNNFTSTEVPDTINSIDLFRYQLVSFGTNLNIFKLSLPQYKITWSIPDFGVYWYRVRAIDTLNSNNGNLNKGVAVPINSVYLTLGSNMVFRPDGRWGVSLGFDYIWQNIMNAEFILNNKSGLIQYKFDGFLKTSENSKLFFRFRLTNEVKENNHNFTQLQLGYSLDVFSRPVRVDNNE